MVSVGPQPDEGGGSLAGLAPHPQGEGTPNKAPPAKARLETSGLAGLAHCRWGQAT